MTQQQAERAYKAFVHKTAQKEIMRMLYQLDDLRLTLFDLKHHELLYGQGEYEAVTTHAETCLLELINAVDNVRHVEKRLTGWVVNEPVEEQQ